MTMPDDEALLLLQEQFQQQWPEADLDALQPVGAHGWLDDEHRMKPDAVVESLDGVTVIPGGAVSVLKGSVGVGKSMAVLQLAVSVAAGLDWFGWLTRGGRVCLLSGSNSAGELQSRLLDVLLHLDRDEREEARAKVSQNLVVAAYPGRRVALVDRHGTPTEWAARLRDKLAGGDAWKLIILDPVSRWGGPWLGESRAVGAAALEAFETFTELPGNPAVLVTVAKRGDFKNKVTRGARTLAEGARMNMLLWQREANRLRLGVTHQSNNPEVPPIELRRDEVGGVLRLETPPRRPPRVGY